MTLLAAFLLTASAEFTRPALAGAVAHGPDVTIRTVVTGPYKAGGRSYLLSGEALRIGGRVSRYEPGQRIKVRVWVGGRKIRVGMATLRDAGGGKGRFSVRFRIWKTGRLTATALHEPNRVLGGGSASTRPITVYSPVSGVGSSGPGVLVLHSMLHRLGYWAPNGDRFTPGTGKAVLAFRKVNSMSRVEWASPNVFRMLHHGKGRMKARRPDLGVHVEADLSRQVLGFFDRGRATEVHVTSSGKASTPTVLGTYRFYRREPGTNSHGMVYSTYFHNGYAIHGYASLPTWPASHGCLRVWVPNAYRIYSKIRIGEAITVYR